MHDFDPENPDALPTAMWDEVLQPDVAKVLAIIDRVEKEEERLARRERVIRDANEQEMQQRMEEARVSSEDEKPGKGKRGPKKKGQSVTHTARNLPEDMQKKMTDKTAHSTLFGKQSKYAWMSGGASTANTPLTRSSSGLPTSQPVKSGALSNSLTAASAQPLQYGVEASDRITWQDAEFALEAERGAGAGVGSGMQALYKGLANRKRI
jgi:hypothetical protein